MSKLSKEDYINAINAANAEADQADTPPEKEKPESTPETPAQAGVSVSEDKKTEETNVEAPKEPELFPGWNAISEETRKAIRDQIAAKDAEIEKRNREFAQSQGRLAPTQQQLSKLQADYAKAQKQLKEYENKHQETLSSDARKKIEQFKQSFPDEADVIETLTAQSYRDAEEARRVAANTEKRLHEFEQRQHVNEQLHELSRVHADWREAISSQEYKTWLSALDPYDKRIIEPLTRSTQAEDAAYVLTRFKRDLAWAQALNGQHAPQQESAAPTKPVAPAVDPDPARRQTAPTKSAGQPMSEKKRAFVEAAEFFEKQRRA